MSCRTTLCEVTLRNLGPDAAAAARWSEEERRHARRQLDAHAGFRRAWQALLQSGRPLVFHNGLLDLMFAYHWLEEPLPERLEDFEAGLRRALAAGTRIFDTKWIAHYAEVGLRLGRGHRTGLEALCEAVAREKSSEANPWRGMPRVRFPDGFEKYSGADASFHEAAYDALCTGKLFAHI